MIRRSRILRPVARGFTLIELMMVVAIVGVLAILGAVGYRRIINTARSAEPKQVLGSIRIAQEARKAETGSYASPSSSLTSYCPSNGTTARKHGWNPACGNGANTWALLPVKVDGPVYYGYASVAGLPGVAPTVPTMAVIGWPTTSTSDWFVAQAQMDINNDGLFARASTSSFSNEIFTENEGE